MNKNVHDRIKGKEENTSVLAFPTYYLRFFALRRAIRLLSKLEFYRMF